jgi:hypothetical protein
MTTSLPRGRSRSTLWRLWVRAPRIRMHEGAGAEMTGVTVGVDSGVAAGLVGLVVGAGAMGEDGGADRRRPC